MTPPPEPRQAPQFAGPPPSFWPIASRSLWASTIYEWPRCRTLAAVDDAATSFVLAASCTNGAATAVKVSGPPSKDNECVRLAFLFRSAPYWPSELTRRPKARGSTTETLAYLIFGTQQHYLSWYVNRPPGGPSTPQKYSGRVIRECSFQGCHWFSM